MSVELGIDAFGPKSHVYVDPGGPLTVPSKSKLLPVIHIVSCEVKATTNGSLTVIVSVAVALQTGLELEVSVTVYVPAVGKVNVGSKSVLVSVVVPETPKSHK
jgi:hypothetical protein